MTASSCSTGPTSAPLPAACRMNEFAWGVIILLVQSAGFAEANIKQYH